jgi:hypothetical protein
MNGVTRYRQRSPEDLQQLISWYKVRDTLLGHNKSLQDVKDALILASVCKHRNAIWLTKLFAGRDVSAREETRKIFLEYGSDPRALCFAALLDQAHDMRLVRRAADLGDAYAQARLAAETDGKERFRWAEKAAMEGERSGFFFLGRCYSGGFGCEQDVQKAKTNYLIAAEQGLVVSMIELSLLLEKNDPFRFDWLGAAAILGDASFFKQAMQEQMRNFGSGTGHAIVIFAIGRALKGHIDIEAQKIFGTKYNFDSLIGPSTQAVQFYRFQLHSYRKAVFSWSIVGVRNNVVKDIRKLIGKMIWGSRSEAKYTI